MEVRLLTLHRAWETGFLSFLLMTSLVGWLPFLGCKTGERIGEDLHLKGAEEESEMTTFLKEMLLKIRGGGAESLGEVCPKFTQVDGYTLLYIKQTVNRDPLYSQGTLLNTL